MVDLKEHPSFLPERMNFHSKANPHWSTIIEWRTGRWDPMSNAPTDGEILFVRGRDKDGNILENIHYAYGGGEEQPFFRGWFIPVDRGYHQVFPVEWQPLNAKY